jgi:hypothetical protein
MLVGWLLGGNDLEGFLFQEKGEMKGRGGKNVWHP